MPSVKIGIPRKTNKNNVPSVQIGVPRKSEKIDYKSIPVVVFNKLVIGI